MSVRRAVSVKAMNQSCQVPGCGRTRRSKNAEWCEGHYYRVRRTGDLQVNVPLAEKRYGPRECVADGCTTSIPNGSYCKKHEARIRRHGDPAIVIPVEERKHLWGPDNPIWTNEPSYAVVHERIGRRKGRAATYPCVDCGGQAAHWSYSGTDYDGLLPYSSDPDDYQPRCVPCHSKHDREKG